jgi:hypothetical protein
MTAALTRPVRPKSKIWTGSGGDTSGVGVILDDQWYTQQRQLSTTLLKMQSVMPLTQNLLFACNDRPCWVGLVVAADDFEILA